MATLVLSAVGSAVGAQIGGSVLGISAAAIGQAAGAVAGALIDQRLLGPGAATVEGPRIARFRVPGGGEGQPLPRVWGRMRVTGQVIWAARFKETVTTRTEGGSGGGKGGGGGAATGETTIREYSYSASFAVALCEGPIERIGRIWADGREISASSANIRLHKGADTQNPDTLISAIEGANAAPAYRGAAYLVFEDLALAKFGNRVPQISVEVFRRPSRAADAEPDLAELIRAVALIPGSGEFSLATKRVRRQVSEGRWRSENVHSFDGRPDFTVSLNQLEEALPNVESVSLVVAWYGDDLRCGRCQIRPGVEARDRDTKPLTWRAGGETRSSAYLISTDALNRPNFGGSPSDETILQAIQKLKNRGYRVTLYPFVMMDVPPGNGLPDPWGWGSEQAAFPWRGRITLDAAPGRPGSTDGTAAAAAEVDAFFGSATRADISWTGQTAAYSGSDNGYRRFVLSLARIAQAAGGVDALILGSELRSLTQIRSGAGQYPAVDQLRDLASEVRAILGPSAALTYAADWSEYFGHQPPDGSGDVTFHLDPLWADANIDAVGVDAYFPLSDWGDDADPAQPDARAITDLAYLRSGVEGGEHYDYYYASDADRLARNRPAITDGAYGEPWIFRPKDLRGWWSNPHHNRPGGVRAVAPTAWIPQSKPIWFTEIGCPAVDRGANQPNLFADGKSSESALPFASRGMRDDFMQRRYLQALLGYWSGAENPVSSLDGRPMIDLANAAVYAWDARPWPDFPLRSSVWADAPNQPTGHWLQGRIGAAPLAEVVAEICSHAGLAPSDIDVSGLDGVVDGYLADRVMSGRELLQALMLAYAFDAVETGGVLKFAPRADPSVASIPLDALVVAPDEDDPTPPLERTREDADAPPQAVRLSYVDGSNDYRAAATEARRAVVGPDRVAASEAPLALTSSAAQTIAERHLAEAWVARDLARFRLAPSQMALEPGDAVDLEIGPGGAERYRLSRVTDADAREVEAVRSDPHVYAPTLAPEALRTPEEPPLPAPPEVAILDLPLLTGDEIAHAPAIAAYVDPWPGPLALWRSTQDDGYALDALIPSPAGLGRTLDPLPPARAWLWTRGPAVRVRLALDTLQSRDEGAVFAGANALAVETPSGAWEVLQFQTAELVDTETFALAKLLRGQAGTEGALASEIPAGARAVLLDAALVQPRLSVSALGLERHYRIGAADQDPDPELFTHLVHAAAGVGLRPYAPAHLCAVAALNGDLSVAWIRRTRVGGDTWEAFETPLGEARERYRLRVEASGAVALEQVLDAPAATLAATALPARPFTLAVAQISDLVGPGPEVRLTLF